MSKNPSPSYVLSRPSGRYFRMVVPPDLVPIVGLRKIRYSLRNGFISTAKYRARRIGGFVQYLFQNFKRQELPEKPIFYGAAFPMCLMKRTARNLCGYLPRTK